MTSETRSARCHAFLDMTFSNPSPVKSISSQTNGSHLLLSGPVSFPVRISTRPWRLVARLVGPVKLPCRLVGITIDDHPLFSTRNMAFLANARRTLINCSTNRGPKLPMHHAQLPTPGDQRAKGIGRNSACMCVKCTVGGINLDGFLDSPHKAKPQHKKRAVVLLAKRHPGCWSCL
jgi:hypothetical protein